MRTRKLLAVLLTFVLLAVAAHFYGRHTRLYKATATLVVESGHDDRGEKVIRALLPQDDASVVLQTVPGTNFFEVSVYDRNPEKAAERTNRYVDALYSKLNDKSSDGSVKIISGSYAEPPALP